MKNFCFNTICNIIQEPQELQRYNRACRFIGKFAVIKYHQLISKVTSISRKSLFDQLATASSFPHPLKDTPIGSTNDRIFHLTSRPFNLAGF